MTKLCWVWSNAMKRHIIDRGLPVPAGSSDIKALSSEHLEARAVHAAKFHENWYSPRPAPRRSIEFRGAKFNIEKPANTIIRQVLFLPGRNGELLLSTAGKVMTCWEVPLGGSGAYPVAEWVSEAEIEQMIVNEDVGKHAHVAVR